MNNSSAPPSGNPLPQGEKRKRSSESPPPPPNVNKTAATRARIVEILASTANGCLSELGYYPGMPARMIELEKQNTTWKEENVKLFQDNRHLLTMVQKIMDFENEVHHLRLENEQLHNNSQVSQEALQNQVQYAQLLEDYRKLTESYRVAYSEVQRLTVDNQRLNAEVQFYKTLQPPQPPPQPPHPLQRSQSISHLKRSATFLPHVQPQLPMAPPQGGQPMVSPSSAVHPHPPSVQNVSQQGQRIDPLHHPQFFQNRHPPGSNPGSRRLSLNIPNPPIHVPSQGPNPVPQSVHFQQPQFGPSPQATFVPFPPPSDHQNRKSLPRSADCSANPGSKTFATCRRAQFAHWICSLAY
ncbi:hypothetical protein CPB84DRAFT_5472 [Gymnopilus junonius]|uniref:Uncharacterized protein n=1 Tax=Gymnopilus junonius TaxID=109634 RepID=A0A9P5TVK3_GYMJU|nr:hypothetical protein CPB84DRAFT_5472 [Gymnopilus junonius]